VGNHAPKDITVERQDTRTSHWFSIDHQNLTSSEGGHTVCTPTGQLIQDRLNRAFRGVFVRLVSRTRLCVEKGNLQDQDWDKIRMIDLCRVILAWDRLLVEIGPGPNFRQFHLRTNRPLYELEMKMLVLELKVAATLVSDNYGGSHLYSLVPLLGVALNEAKVVQYLQGEIAGVQ
jgi:hypothetical protein